MLKRHRRNRVRQHFLLVLVCLISLLTVVSASAEVHTVSLMHCWGDIRAPWMEEMIASFEAEHPNILVDNILVGCGADLREKTYAAAAAGILPDIVMVQTRYIRDLIEMEMFQPLDVMMDQDGIGLDTWYPSEIEGALMNGRTFGFPIRTGGDVNSIVFYNRDIFQRAGLNDEFDPMLLPEFFDVSRKLVVYDGDRLKQGAWGIAGGNEHALGWLYASGAELFSEDETEVVFNRTEGVTAAAERHRYFNEIYRDPGDLGDLGALRTAFAQGQMAMVTSGAWETSFINDANPDLNYSLTLAPRHPDSKYVGAHVGTFVYAVSSDADLEVAWPFLKWLTLREESAGFFMLRQGRPSPVRAFNLNPMYFELNPRWDVVGQALEQVATMPVHLPYFNDVVAMVSAVITNHEVNPQSGMDDAARQAQALIDEYVAR